MSDARRDVGTGEPSEPVVPGVSLADVALPTVDGATLRLGDLRGRRVLLFCWASW